MPQNNGCEERLNQRPSLDQAAILNLKLIGQSPRNGALPISLSLLQGTNATLVPLRLGTLSDLAVQLNLTISP